MGTRMGVTPSSSPKGRCAKWELMPFLCPELECPGFVISRRHKWEASHRSDVLFGPGQLLRTGSGRHACDAHGSGPSPFQHLQDAGSPVCILSSVGEGWAWLCSRRWGAGFGLQAAANKAPNLLCQDGQNGPRTSPNRVALMGS